MNSEINLLTVLEDRNVSLIRKLDDDNTTKLSEIHCMWISWVMQFCWISGFYFQRLPDDTHLLSSITGNRSKENRFCYRKSTACLYTAFLQLEKANNLAIMVCNVFHSLKPQNQAWEQTLKVSQTNYAIKKSSAQQIHSFSIVWVPTWLKKVEEEKKEKRIRFYQAKQFHSQENHNMEIGQLFFHSSIVTGLLLFNNFCSWKFT